MQDASDIVAVVDRRTDVAAWLNETQPAFIRLPGGCYVEGTDLMTGGWFWKKTLGQIESRPGHMNDVWGYWTDDGLGMYEFLKMAEDTGAKPLLVVNSGCSTRGCVSGDELKPFIQDALDAVEYVRAALAHLASGGWELCSPVGAGSPSQT